MSDNEETRCYSTPREHYWGHSLCARINHDAKTIKFFVHRASDPSMELAGERDNLSGKDGEDECKKYSLCQSLLSNLQDYSVKDG